MNWKSSSFCGESGCLEVGRLGSGHVFVRNRSQPDEVPSVFTAGEWPYFLDVVSRTGWSWWFRGQDQTTFTPDEAKAFKAGVLAGEFEYDRLPNIDTLD